MARSSVSLLLSGSSTPCMHSCAHVHAFVMRLKVNLHYILQVYSTFYSSYTLTIPSLSRLFLIPPALLPFHQREREGEMSDLAQQEVYLLWVLSEGSQGDCGNQWKYMSPSLFKRAFVVQYLLGDCVCVCAHVCLWCLQQCQCPPTTTSHNKPPTNTQGYLRLQLLCCECV